MKRRKPSPLPMPGRPDVPPRPRPKLPKGKIEKWIEAGGQLPARPPSPKQKRQRRQLKDKLEVLINGRSRQL